MKRSRKKIVAKNVSGLTDSLRTGVHGRRPEQPENWRIFSHPDYDRRLWLGYQIC